MVFLRQPIRRTIGASRIPLGRHQDEDLSYRGEDYQLLYDKLLRYYDVSLFGDILETCFGWPILLAARVAGTGEVQASQ